jgi:hypothetical protein
MQVPDPKSDVVLNVYSLLPPSMKVLVNLGNFQEEAALITRAYQLTGDLERKGRAGPRRPLPSVEPELTMYKNLRPWKKLPVPNYVIVVEDATSSIIGAPVLYWDGKKSLQGTAPWGRPVVGVIAAQGEAAYEVTIDPVAMEVARQQAEKRALRKAAKIEVAPQEPIAPPVVVVEVPEPVAVVGTAAPVEEREEEVETPYTGDAFTVSADGHYVGDDGFIVPMDFDEFYERYPKYVLNWVKKRLNRFQVDEDVEDWTQDLLIHMKFLPVTSKHRHPGANGRVQGCQDVIETFNPLQQYGASERRFRNYINFCLANKFNTVQSKRQKNPVCRPGTVPFNSADYDPTMSQGHAPIGDEYIHQNSEHLKAVAERQEKQNDDRHFTNQFKEFVMQHDPSVFPALEALERTGPLAEAATYMNVTEQEFSRYRARLKQLGECFVNNTEVPKQRKPYKKRTTAAAVGEKV